MSFHVVSGGWEALGEYAMRIRHEVFVLEQGVPAELEHDASDAVSLHVLARSAEGECVGTGRLLPDGHIGRLAVCAAWRGQGVGRALMTYLLAAAEENGHAQVVLHAQVDAVPFYASLGFREEGGMFMEAGIPHITMQRAFNSAA